jgi:hypothetical protein
LVLFLFVDDKRELSTLAAETADGKKNIDSKPLIWHLFKAEGKKVSLLQNVKKTLSQCLRQVLISIFKAKGFMTVALM